MSDDALPLCACEQYYDSHHPECPARRAYEAALLKLAQASGFIRPAVAKPRLSPAARGEPHSKRCCCTYIGGNEVYNFRTLFVQSGCLPGGLRRDTV